MVHRSSSSSLSGSDFLPPADWHSFSIPNFSTFPKHKLSRSELKFLSRLLVHPQSNRSLPLYSSDELAFLLKECFSRFLSAISSSTLRKHLLRGKGYAEQHVYSSGHSLRLFSKGLVRGFRFPTETGYHLLYGYPRHRYRLQPNNFISPYPPHSEFLELIKTSLWSEVPEGLLHVASDEMLGVPHWDGSGNYIADGCYRLTFADKPSSFSYVWLEAHTGTEGYDRNIFLKQILTAEQNMKERGEFLIVVPFTIDLDKARTAIRKYNKLPSVVRGERPEIVLEVTKIIDYRRLKHWKDRKGLLKHRKKV